jgi:rhamnulokinase
MSDTARFITVDLGAESGRTIAATLAQGKIGLEVMHRFPNEPQRILGRFHWDTIRLFAEIKRGLALCAKQYGSEFDGIGVDTWGVDFALLDKNDDLLGLPYHYRDSRTEGMMEEVFKIVPRSAVYRTTGIQFMVLNSLYQLMALKRSGSPALDKARSFLMTPDLLNYWLSGEKANEFSNATTTQCFDPNAGDWARPMLETLGIPTGFLGSIVQPGATLGPLHASVRGETSLGAVPVIAPATHDTGSAVAAVPAEGGRGWAYISCGTWSLVGLETPKPVITDQTLEYNLTNEGGVYGTYRLLRNVMGLWLLQQCRRSWEKAGHSYGYDELTAMSTRATPFAATVDPDDPLFLNPTDMPEAIRQYCARTGQAPPADVAGMVRCIVESLALKYRWVIRRLEKVSGERIHTVHIIGGGGQNALLCQATADACACRVLAGPTEATALGNALVQAIAAGKLGSLADARAMVARSFPLVEYTPQTPGAWDQCAARFDERLV